MTRNQTRKRNQTLKENCLAVAIITAGLAIFFLLGHAYVISF